MTAIERLIEAEVTRQLASMSITVHKSDDHREYLPKRLVKVVLDVNVVKGDRYVKPYTYIDTMAVPLRVGARVKVPVGYSSELRSATVVAVDVPAVNFTCKEVAFRISD